VPLRGIGK